MGYSLIENLETLHESKEAFLEKLDIILPNPSGLTIHDSWDTIGTFITNILVDNQIFPPEVIEELERLLGNNLQKTIQVTATKIKPYTFYGESSLVAIIAQNATNIGQYAFNNCTNLKLANIQAATNIESYAFSGCNKLETVGLESSTKLNSYAFNGCTKLEHINFSKINYISDYAFQSCQKINNLDLSNCTYIGNYAFNSCTSIGPILYLDNSGTVYSYAFQSCSNIEEIIITNKAKNLKEYSLYNINNNVKRILCEYPSKPSAWHSYWNYGNYPVYWNAEVKDWVFVYNNDKPNSTLTTRIIDEFPDEGTKEGYVFDCWCTDSSLETKCELPYTSPEAFPVLYARWLISVNIHTYNTETGEWYNYGIYHISQLSDIQKLKINITVDELYMDAEFTIPLTNISQITPNCDVYITGITRTLYELGYTGEVDNIILQPGTYKLECWGAQGGYRSTSYINMAGKGAYSVGYITLDDNTPVYAYVGGSGNTGGATGGFNGGGSRATYVGGGGASDIRIGNDSLYARVIVAGGGGSCGSPSYFGGYGGGSVGQDANNGCGSIGYGGTQISSPGTMASVKGSFGKGGYGAYYASGYGGAGGGGWYGGTGCYPDGSVDDDKGGGGGSGWIYTEATYTNWAQNSSEGQSGQWLLNSSYYLVDAYLKAGNETFLNPEGIEEVGHSGNGYIRITQIRN